MFGVSQIRKLLDQHRDAGSLYLRVSLIELYETDFRGIDQHRVDQKILLILLFSEIVSVDLQLAPRKEVYGSAYVPCIGGGFASTYGQALTSLRIPKDFGRAWMLDVDGKIACSYLLNKAMCRWFDCASSELVAFNLQPLKTNSVIGVRGMSAGVDERLTCEVVTYTARLSSMSARSGLYPLLLGSLFTPVESVFVDMAILEIPAGHDVNCINLTMDVFPRKVVNSILKLQVDGSAALLLQEGEESNLYAVSLSDAFVLQTEQDVADYVRSLYAWADEPEIGPLYDLADQAKDTPLPGTRLDNASWAACTGSCRLFVWSYTR